MLVRVALDHDLVSSAAHDRAPAPAIALIDLITQTCSELTHINVSLKGLQFCSLVHETPAFLSLLPVPVLPTNCHQGTEPTQCGARVFWDPVALSPHWSLLLGSLSCLSPRFYSHCFGHVGPLLDG